MAIKKAKLKISPKKRTVRSRKKPGTGKISGNGGAGFTALRTEIAGLKKMVMLQRVKQGILARKTVGAAEVDHLLTSYLKVILTMTGTASGSILIHEDDHLVFRASVGPSSSKLIGRRMPLTEGIAGWVFRSGKTYHSSDVSRDKHWSNRISAELRYPTGNVLAAPIKTADATTGVIEIINKRGKRRFSKDDREILRTLTGQLALDVTYATLLSRSIQEAQHRATQMGLAMLLNSSLNQREVRKEAIAAVASLLDAEVGSLLLVDKATNELFFEVALGEKEKQVKQMRLKMGEGIAGWVAVHDQPVLINDVQNDPRYFRRAQTLTDFITRNMVCVPVRTRGMVVGVLQAINKKGGGFFTEEDLENCLTLSNQVAIALENAHLFAEVKEMFLNTAEALAAAVEKKDPYTGGHIKRVVEYSMAIARHMSPPAESLDDLRLAAVLHDIGKIGVKDSVLLKRGELNEEEVAHMRQHPLVGEDILVHIDQLRSVRKIMRAHHEKWDGSGYPDGLKGEAIPLHARIIAIADTFDAITTDRPYRKAADWRSASEEIRRFSGKEYDPRLVEAFTRACEAGDVTIVQGR
jgi:HD-GYP domain-containing protein (c-di-GMP phosphodiesterase class II)